MKWKETIKTIALILAALTAAVTVLINATGCATTHSVTQSVEQKLKGDTTVTVIKYEQTGKMQR